MEEPRRLGNRYELGAVLGRGGMAEVFMARDIRLGRAVAVKTLRADMARDATFQARFRREAQSAASLNHPAIVAVYDTGEDYIGGISLPYIVMEYVDGSTLRDLLHSGRRLLPERAMEITAGVLQALDYSHRNGIVHRDIKPGNVMLTRGGAVKVMDFGIARAMGDVGMTMTQTSAVIGTAQYLSPEQAKGETVDARSDLYSTACLLYELLTGRPPFVGDSPVAVAYQHVREAPLPPSHFDPELPAVADAIVLKGLGKHPDERYQSADDMRADIERALDGRPISAAPSLAAGYGGASAPTQVVSGARGYDGGQGSGGYGPQTRYQPTQYQPAYDAEPDDSLPRQRRADNTSRGKKSGDKTGYIILAVVGVVAIALAVVVLKTVFSGSSGPKSTTVPNITGQTVAQATTTLKTSGLVIGSSTCGSGEPSSQFASGQIASQNPDSGASIDSGQPVSYCLSSGPQKNALPDTAALNQNTSAIVQQRLQAAGYTNITQIQQASTSVPAGNVIDLQDGNGNSIAGKYWQVTQPVVIVVSSGPGNANVPNVIGHQQGDATNILKQAGFPVGGITYTNSDYPAGTVVSENPAQDTSQPKNTPISLVISQGPAGGTPTGSPTGTPSGGAGLGGLLGGNNQQPGQNDNGGPGQ
jgi:eukaryotic-like serine/threonine-protein kinase